MARPKLRYKIDGISDWREDDVESCVYKLSYGRGYVIIKAKILYGSLRAMQKSLNQYANGSAGQHSKKSLYWKFFNYVVMHPNNKFKVQILLESKNGYRLLKAEQHYVKKAKRDKKFGMNVRGGAYIPKWNPEANDGKGAYNWISPNELMNYNKYIDKPYIEPVKKKRVVYG
jgi:hypothetical protein